MLVSVAFTVAAITGDVLPAEYRSTEPMSSRTGPDSNAAVPDGNAVRRSAEMVEITNRTLEQQSATVRRGQTKTMRVWCAESEFALSGGYYTSTTHTNTRDDTHILKNGFTLRARPQGHAAREGWVVQAHLDDQTGSTATVSVTVYVHCWTR